MDRLPDDAGGGPAAVLSRFRREFRACLSARADELAELADAVLCADGPVRNLAGLSLAPGHRRGHGALYDAVNCGRVEIARLRWSLAALPLPRAADGRLMLAVDVSNWLRPGAATSPERLFCHVYGLWVPKTCAPRPDAPLAVGCLPRVACRGVGRSSACGAEADLLDCHPGRVAAGVVAAGGVVERGRDPDAAPSARCGPARAASCSFASDVAGSGVAGAAR
jgi:DDE superfamily endonuclease